MNWLSWTFAILAIILATLGYLGVVIAAFRVSRMWGLLVLIPPMQLMFLLVHWEDARLPFYCGLLALAAIVPVVALNWEPIQAKAYATIDGVLEKHGQVRRGAVDNSPPAVLARKKAALLEHANEMNTRYADLVTRQQTLESADAATKAAFEADAAAYAALRKQVETEKAEVEALEREPVLEK